MRRLTKAQRAKIITLAQDQHHRSGEVEVDDNARISYTPAQATEGGTYVQAWVWVEFDHAEVLK